MLEVSSSQASVTDAGMFGKRTALLVIEEIEFEKVDQGWSVCEMYSGGFQPVLMKRDMWLFRWVLCGSPRRVLRCRSME